MEVKINELMAIVAAADLTTDNGAATLETALLEDFRARDLHVYFDFAHQYNATSDQKRRHDKLIQRLRDTYAKYIDRAADLGIDGATKHGDFIEVDAPDGSELCPTLLDRPLGSIVREVKRKEARREGKIIEAINDIKRGQDDLYAQGEGIRSDTIGMSSKLDTLTDKANEMQAAANLTVKQTKDNKKSIAALMRGKVEFGKTLDTIEKAVTNIDHTCNGTAANVAEVLTNTPSLEMMQRLETLAHAGKKPETAISQPTAVEIFNLLLPHKTITQQTLSNWLKRGNCPKAGSFPIAQTDLASKAAFVTWVQNYATAAGTQTVQLTKELIAKINAL